MQEPEGKEIRIGDYIIINNTDKPCTRLIAEVVEVDQARNFVRAKYLCKNTNMKECYGRLSEATLISEFGVICGKERDMLKAAQISPSKALYRDGRSRDWQPQGENPIQELRKSERRK